MLGHLDLDKGTFGAGSYLTAIWDRRTFNLPKALINRKVLVIKDLDKVWSSLRWKSVSERGKSETWSQYDTVLVDDSPAKAVLQPNNHLCVPEFTWEAATQKEEVAPRPADRQMLHVIGKLEALRSQSNISACLKDGKWSGEGGDKPGSTYWEQKGRIAYKKAGISPGMGTYDSDWVIRVREVGREHLSASIADLCMRQRWEAK